MTIKNDPNNFWIWFLKGSGGEPGYKRIWNKWVYFHISVGIVLSIMISMDLKTAANSVLLPLVGILIGLSFAWAGNVQSLMQSKELDKLSEYHEGGFVEYIFIYQEAILIILLTIIVWAFAGLNVYDSIFNNIRVFYFIMEIILYCLTSLTIRVCWHVILGTNLMLIFKRKISKLEEK